MNAYYTKTEQFESTEVSIYDKTDAKVSLETKKDKEQMINLKMVFALVNLQVSRSFMYFVKRGKEKEQRTSPT